MRNRSSTCPQWQIFLAAVGAMLVCGGVSSAQFVSGSWAGSDSYSGSSGFGSGYSWGGGNLIGSSGTSNDWTLGITGDNTDVGVYVRQVSPNSSGSRAGIRAGDVIVCVANVQVGRAGNRVFDLSEELARHADASGRVRLLVLEGSSRQLRSMQVQLDRQQGGLSGNLVVRGARLSPDSLVTVELENVTRPHFVVRNGRESFRVTNSYQNNIPFQLNYDPRYISQSDSYRVRATIVSGGRVTHVSDQQPFVLTQGYPSTVQLSLSPSSYGTATQLPSNNVITASYPGYNNGLQRVSAAYQRYLGRPASAVELAVWQRMPDIEYRLGDLPIELMSSQEYFDRVGNNNLVWVEKVFREMLGRNATQLELDQWMRRFGELRYSRMELMRQLKLVSAA